MLTLSTHQASFISIVAISFCLRLIGLNLMGRTWDEAAYIAGGDTLVNHYFKGEFAHPNWYTYPDHPPLARYLYGLAGKFNLQGYTPTHDPIYAYDWTAPRLVAVTIGSLAIGFTYLLGLYFFNHSTSLLAALSLSLIPLNLGLSQLATIDVFVLCGWAASLYASANLSRHPSTKTALVCGATLGLTLLTKYTNILVIPAALVTHWLTPRRQPLATKTLLITLFSLISIILLLWPPLLFAPTQLLPRIFNLATQSGHVAETFLGTYQNTPPYYYLVYLLLTLPPLLLVFSLFGFKRLSPRQRNLLLTWFCLPLLLSLLTLRRNGLRYVIPLTIPLSFAAAAQLSRLKPQFIALVLASLLYSLYSVYPYPLDYYNLFIGGPKNVYRHHLFNLGWWGQGQRQALINLAPQLAPNQSVGLAVTPLYVAPPIQGIRFGLYSDQPDYPYDYLVVNTLWQFDHQFDLSTLNQNYTLIDQVKAGGAPLVHLFAHK